MQSKDLKLKIAKLRRLYDKSKCVDNQCAILNVLLLEKNDKSKQNTFFIGGIKHQNIRSELGFLECKKRILEAKIKTKEHKYIT